MVKSSSRLPENIADKASIRLFPGDEQTTAADVRRAGFTSAFYHLDTPPGDVWTVPDIQRDQERLMQHGVRWAVVESLMIDNEQLYGGSRREEMNRNSATTIRNLAACGIHHVMINLMGSVNWFRTGFDRLLPDGTISSYFDRTQLAAILEHADTKGFIQFPAWPKKVHRKELEGPHATEEQVLTHAKDLFSEILPVAEQVGSIIEVHGDDPNESICGLPRVVKNPQDYDRLFAMDQTGSRVLKATFCTGALGQSENDLPSYLIKLARENRLGDLHLRDIKRTDTGFTEVRHGDGDVDLPGCVEAYLDSGFADKRWWRPDHTVKTDPSKPCLPGYEFAGRAQAAHWLRGMMEGFYKKKQSSG